MQNKTSRKNNKNIKNYRILIIRITLKTSGGLKDVQSSTKLSITIKSDTSYDALNRFLNKKTEKIRTKNPYFLTLTDFLTVSFR